jgi:hypothetical protein
MTRTKKLFALIVAVLMAVAILPVAAFAEEIATAVDCKKTDEYWKMVWAPLDEVEAEMIAKGASPAECTYAVYKAALASPYIDAGSIADLDDNGFSFTTKGMHGGYDYKIRHIPHVSSLTPELVDTIIEVAAARADVDGTKTASSNGPTSKNVLLVGPWYSSDSSFTDQYKTEAQQLANDLGGTYTALQNSNAYGTAIASGHLNKGIVIYDSHGASYSSTSYIQLTTSNSLTSTDYSNGWAYNGSSWWGIDGRYVQNHCGGTLSNCMVWMAMCEGMKKSGGGKTGTALLAAGAGVVYGYSQSVSFTGDYKYEAYFWNRMRAGDTVAEAFTKMTAQYGNWDPAYSSSSGAAWPIVMSPVDAYPSNPDSHQTVYSDWVMFPTAAYTVTATSNNTSYGTVSVSGTTITASPKTGYYVESCTLVSGTATWTINGNTIEVNPSSDCTIRVNFAAKTQNTVTFIASGTVQGTQTAYTGDSITLPTTAAVNPDGWTFIGWVTAQVAETETRPTYYAPGASYTVTGNTTLYALYNRTEGGGGTVSYQLVDSIQDGGKFIIVANSSISGTTGYAVGNTVLSSYGYYLTPVSVTISNNVCTATTANLPKVVWVASGNDSAGYSFYNEAVGKYMGLNSSEYLYPSSTAVAWKYTSNQWLDNQIDSEGYYYLSYTTSGTTRYTTSKTSTSSDLTIKLYQEIQEGTTYYTTDPVASTPTYTVTFKDWDGTVLKTETVEQGGAATAPANPTRVGYTFTGWDVAFNNVQSDLVVTAQYQINTYTVTFKDWDGTVLKTQTVAYGGAATAPANPTRVGYTFTGWDVAFNYITGNLTVTAQYTINTYTVTFVDWDGTVLKTQTVAYGGAATAPTDPTREGYTFIGWDVAFNYITGNLTVTAQYEEDVPPVTILPGDVDCNGLVNMADLALAASYVQNSGTVTEQGILNGDMNGDGAITAADLAALYQLILG